MILSKYIKDFQKILKVSDTENIWKRNIALLCIAQFIAMMGMNGLVPFLPLFVRDLGIVDEQAARFWSSMIFAGPYFLSVIAVPIWGLLGDRHGQKPMVIRASFGLGVAIFLMGFSQSVEQLFILRVIQGAVSGFIASALAFATKNTPPERSGYAIGLLQSSSSAGVIVGPFLGGLLSDLVGIRPVFFIVALLCIISGICSWVYLIETDKSRELTKSATMRANLNFLKSNKAILFLIVTMIVAQAGLLMSSPIFPFFVERLHAPAQFLSTVTGLLIAMVGIFSIIFAPYWGRQNDKRDYHKVLVVTSCICGVGFLLHIFMPHYLLLFPLRGIIGIFYAGIIPTIYSAMNKIIPAEIKGGIMGFASSASLFGALVSYLMCSAITAKYDINIVFIFSGIMMLSVAGGTLIDRQRHNRAR